ncbi:leucine-rich_repeat domain-containing protein [Hexamita inflata]|uniref:Leucine-rich_repeat domain-containing protein n=1 Tax=Hexamita inflata TaxID=28002 RepID=A0ABP1GRP5_9EUKA
MRNYNNHMVTKYSKEFKPDVSRNPQDKRLQICNDVQVISIGFLNHFANLQELYIYKCINVSFESALTTVTKLSVVECQLEYIEGIGQMKQLQQLDLSKNKLEDVNELQQLNNLTHLNLSFNSFCNISVLQYLTSLQNLSLQNNKIIFIQPVCQLPSLVHLSVRNNVIQDMVQIKNLQAFQYKWVDVQNVLTECDVRNYLGFSVSTEQVTELYNQLITSTDQNEQIQYEAKMINKYKFSVQAQRTEAIDKIVIGHDNSLTTFSFIDQISGVTELHIRHCPNVRFDIVPKNLKILVIKNCGLKSIEGIEQMDKLEILDLSNNEIVSVQPLKDLKLKQLLLNQNCITDFSPLNIRFQGKDDQLINQKNMTNSVE